jgi:hypothetical protein
MALLREIGTTVLLVKLTLWLQSAGLAALIFWVRRAVAGDLHGLGRFALPHWWCNSRPRDRFAWCTNSVLGRLRSLALLTFLGVSSLFFGQQLCHHGLWRGSPTVKLANAGAAREHYRRVDVRHIRERPVCNSRSARQPRCAIFALIL